MIKALRVTIVERIVQNPRVWRAFFLTLVAVGVVTGVFLLARSAPRIPPLPRIEMAVDELETSVSGLNDRIAGFAATAEEKALIAILEQLHFSETHSAGAGGELEIKEQMEAFQASAIRIHRQDQQRYLLLGDFLATGFERSLFEVCAQVATTSGDLSRVDLEDTRWRELRRRGGAFLTRSFRQGLLDRQGGVRGPKIAPRVLYQVRWRQLAGLPGDVGLSVVERKTYYDVLAAFGERSAVDRRLWAVDQLRRLDPRYDAGLARAVVLYEANMRQRARAELRRLLANGRQDSVIDSFERALSERR